VAISNEFAVDLRATREPNLTPALLQYNPAAYPDPAYACATGAVGPMHPSDNEFPEVERLLNKGYLTHTGAFERFDSWGMWNDKDLNSFPLPAVGYPNTHRLWMAGHHQQPETAWRMYLRSGDHNWLDWARDYTDHFMNVDTVNYDDPDHLLIGTRPDGKELVGSYVHFAGTQYHCKGYVHWASDLNAATHWVSPTTFLLDYYLTGDYAARDTYRLWASALNRMPLAAGASRDVNNTMAHVVPLYEATGDSQLLLFIHRMAEGLLGTPFRDHISGQYHPLWANRYYDLTRDPRVLPRVVEAIAAGSTDTGSWNALAYRLTGDRKYLTMMFNRVIASGKAIYLNPNDPLDGYSTARPLAGDSFYMMALPTYLAAVHDAGLKLEIQPPEKIETRVLEAGKTSTLPPLVSYLQPDGATDTVTLQFLSIKPASVSDYVGSHISATTIELRDANGQLLLDTSVAAAMQRTQAMARINVKEHPAPWRVLIGAPVNLKFFGATSLSIAPVKQ
jgi:hypothetical protein